MAAGLRAPQLSPRALALRVTPLLALGVAAVAVLYSWPPLPQPQSYHDFADQRMFVGIPHFLNVVSNAPFAVVGLLGIAFLLRGDTLRLGGPFLESRERWPFFVFFAGVFLTAFGSGFYHLSPNNERLMWDRLPLAVAFMALSAAILSERVHPQAGRLALVPLLAIGVASVLYWHWTEQQGRGDLRFYLAVQFYPLLALPLLLLLFPARYTRTADLCIAFGWYTIAKVCEHPLDQPIFELGGWISGHTLKHLAAALGAYWILRMVQRRRPQPAVIGACAPAKQQRTRSGQR
jgi:predicted membrane channel-forming protein YqfA (hemolysin III family)